MKYNKNKEAIERFKSGILSNIDNVDIDFETGFCYKRMSQNYNDEDKSSFDYFQSCYFFLKGLSHFLGVKTIC